MFYFQLTLCEMNNKDNIYLNEIDLESPMIKYIEERSQILTMAEILKIFPNNPSTKILKRLEVDFNYRYGYKRKGFRAFSFRRKNHR